MGNKGVIGPGDVQWMNAGSGIIHQEMPRGDAAGVNMGFQLWVNLPADHKMMPPGYQEIQADQVPTVTDSGGATVRVVCGEVAGTRGPVADVMVAPEYLDVTVPEGASFVHPVPRGHTAFAYVFEGSGTFGAGPEGDAGIQGEGTLVQYGDGEAVRVAAAGGTVRFLLVSGKPLGEPVAWHGPIVMNTKEQIREALHDLDAGTFIRHPA
jgi:redox-sensitive bicupin YhaK (pirin superfamily)